MRTASPNQDGVEGTACEEVWIFTDTSAILLIIYLLVGNTFVLPHQGDIFFCWFATGYISLRNSWATRARRRLLVCCLDAWHSHQDAQHVGLFLGNRCV